MVLELYSILATRSPPIQILRDLSGDET